MTTFWKFTYRTLVSFRHWLDSAIAHARRKSGYKPGGRAARPEPIQ